MPFESPHPQNITKAISYIITHPAVTKLQEIKQDDEGLLVIIHRSHKSKLKTLLTDFYMLGIADIYDMLQNIGKVDALVSVNNWGGYSKEVKGHCKQLKIGLFMLDEFLEAINYDGKEFIYYQRHT